MEPYGFSWGDEGHRNGIIWEYDWLLDSYRAGESSFKSHLHCNFMTSCRRFDVLWGKGATRTASICFSRKILVKRAKTTWRWLIKPNTLVVRDLNIGSNYCRWFWFKKTFYCIVQPRSCGCFWLYCVDGSSANVYELFLCEGFEVPKYGQILHGEPYNRLVAHWKLFINWVTTTSLLLSMKHWLFNRNP